MLELYPQTISKARVKNDGEENLMSLHRKSLQNIPMNGYHKQCLVRPPLWLKQTPITL